MDIEVDHEDVQDGEPTAMDKSLRGTPEELRNRSKRNGKSRTKAKRGETPKRLFVLEDHHKEIEDLLRKGVTRRVIHTKLGISRDTLDRYISEHEDLAQAWKDAQEDMLDLNEEIVSEIAAMDCSMETTENGNFPRFDGRSLATKFNAAKFRLERLGGKRGWNPKLETNEVGNGGRAPVIVVGEVTDSMISEADAENKRAYEEACIGLENISRG